MTETMYYPSSGSLEDLASTCGGDEDGFRARLVGLERAENDDGEQATKATYEVIPPQQPYVKKELIFIDLADPEDQPANTDVVFDNADVYLDGAEAQVAVYRDK